MALGSQILLAGGGSEWWFLAPFLIGILVTLVWVWLLFWRLGR